MLADGSRGRRRGGDDWTRSTSTTRRSSPTAGVALRPGKEGGQGVRRSAPSSSGWLGATSQRATARAGLLRPTAALCAVRVPSLGRRALDAGSGRRCADLPRPRGRPACTCSVLSRRRRPRRAYPRSCRCAFAAPRERHETSGAEEEFETLWLNALALAPQVSGRGAQRRPAAAGGSRRRVLVTGPGAEKGGGGPTYSRYFARLGATVTRPASSCSASVRRKPCTVRRRTPRPGVVAEAQKEPLRRCLHVGRGDRAYSPGRRGDARRAVSVELASRRPARRSRRSTSPQVSCLPNHRRALPIMGRAAPRQAPSAQDSLQMSRAGVGAVARGGARSSTSGNERAAAGERVRRCVVRRSS